MSGKRPTSELLMVEQRNGHGAGAAWVLEAGQRIEGQDDDRRIAEVRSGLTRHARVRTHLADASDEDVERTLAAIHERDYLDTLDRAPAGAPVLMPELAPPGLEPDMPVSAEAVAAAREGIRTAIAAAQRTIDGARYTYALSRPPGHHAGPRWLAGYCYLNTSAAAAHTLREGGIESVGILDLDLHYPNGTAAMLGAIDGTSLHSLHAWPVTNVPELTVMPSNGRERVVEFRAAPSPAEYLDAVWRSLEELSASADALVLSLGYDTVRGDPHGSWELSPKVFTDVGRLLAASDLPVCVVQEGGYALDVLAECSHAFVEGLLEESEET